MSVLRDRGTNDWHHDEWDNIEAATAVADVPGDSRVAKWLVWTSLLVVVGLILAAGAVGWWYVGKVRPPADEVAVVNFTVTDSDTISSISTRLAEQGLIVDPEVFEWYVDRQGGVELTPGFYQFKTGDHMGSVLARLQTSPAETYRRITFPEGFTIAQMGERLAENSPRLQQDAFITAATNGSISSEFLPAGQSSLEGLLFPDTYQVSNADNEGQIVERMATLMERVALQEDLVAKAAELGRTPYEILTIASMIEREAKVDVDRAKIARVIYNRLEIDMLLQIDATLFYGVPNFDGPFSELRQIEGPYNTYLNKGLPPTPIANPGRASIQAALNPAPNPAAGDPICQELEDPTVGCRYLYYVLGNADGEHVFAATAEQHEANIERARQLGLL